MKNIFYTFFLFLILGACSNGKETSYRPDKLLFGMAISVDNDQTYGKMKAFKDYLSKKLKMEVEIVQVTNGSAVIEAARANKLHIATLGTFSYIVAKNKLDISPIVMPVSRESNDMQGYHSYIITPANSKLNNMDDVIDNLNKLTLAWAYPTSTSGHLIPKAYFQKVGINDEDFKDIMISESHIASIFSVVSGKIDLAAVDSNILMNAIRIGSVNEGDFKIIWKSDPIPHGPIFVNNQLDKRFIKELQQAFIDLAIDDPKAADDINFSGNYPLKYVAVNDSVYQPLTEVAKAVGLLQ